MKLRVILLCFLLSFFLAPASALAVECDLNGPLPPTEQLPDYITECARKVAEKQGQANTLKTVLDVLNSKIRLIQAQIKQTTTQITSLENDISTLSTVVSDLDNSLIGLTKVFLARVRESYIRRDPDPISLLVSSDSFAKFFTRIRYLSIVKARDQLIISEMETARKNYDTQKNAKVRKQQEVEELKTKLVNQQVNLAAQQRSKNDLLVQTRNDEARYQSLIARANEELEAINAIIARPCSESESKTPPRDVSQGEVIAKIIGYDLWKQNKNSSSCNSGGAHLHFIVADRIANKMIVKNPFNYLKSADNINCSGIDKDGRCYAGDLFNPINSIDSWNWPIDPAITLNQGYGYTWAVKNTWVGKIYDFHNGLDIIGTSENVKAVQPGKLYSDAYVGSNNCALQYVCVDHKDTNVDTFYLHVNYN